MTEGERMHRPEVVVITGASAGVGRATVREFARRHACIGLIARGHEALEATAAEVVAMGGDALVLPADVADYDEVNAAAEEVERTFGPIDIWINNAMTTVFAPVPAIRPEEFRRVTDVTYHGYVWGTMAALERMRPRNCGTIVQVGSALAYHSIPLQAAYCGAKHAIRGFTDSLRSELLHEGSDIHLTMVQLPGLNTPQFDWCESRMTRRARPVPPIYQPEVAARAIYFAAHHRRREIYVGWPTVKTVLGSKLAPGLLDRYLSRVAWEGQQTDEPAPTDAPVNLFTPVAGDHGAHGRFDADAESASEIAWLTNTAGAGGLRAMAVAATLGVVLLTGMALVRRR
jgi:NAD(P)-dependent dehydrogenase (short-subunit alcohol dehydrogenase family)